MLDELMRTDDARRISLHHRRRNSVMSDQAFMRESESTGFSTDKQTEPRWPHNAKWSNRRSTSPALATSISQGRVCSSELAHNREYLLRLLLNHGIAFRRAVACASGIEQRARASWSCFDRRCNRPLRSSRDQHRLRVALRRARRTSSSNDECYIRVWPGA